MLSLSAPTHVTAPVRLYTARFVRHVYTVRVLALLLGSVSVVTVLCSLHVSMPAWVLAALYVLVWPHVAYLTTRRSARPARTDSRNLMIDAAMIGMWIALMRFNLLPTVTLAMPLGMVLVVTGGLWRLARGLAVTALACAAVAAFTRAGFQPHSSVPEMVASLPALMVLPWLTGLMMYRLERRVRRQNRLLLRLGSIDSLSALLNRRHWDEAVAQCFDGCNRQAALLLIDIDHFKQVNDRYGHTVGDEVIRRMGAIIRGSLREGDVAGRYGGDEFGVLLAGATLEMADRVAERIRTGVASATFDSAPGLACTVSIGVAAGGSLARAPRDWIAQADKALYRAKMTGRNRAACAA